MQTLVENGPTNASQGERLKSLRHLSRFICTFLTKAACCRNMEIVLHPTNELYSMRNGVMLLLLITYIYIYIYFLTCPHIATLYCELRSWVVCTPNIKVNPCALVFFYLALCLVWCFQLRHIYIYSSFWRRCLINSSCDSEFHIHGVICMIVRHKENVLGSATYSDFYVSC